MNSRANPMESYPYPVEGAQCPLLVAIWPLRYAIGVDPGIEADAMELPPLDGNFPALDAEREQASPMHYSRRLLRDGWLYIWLEEQGRLIEYSVDDAYLSETDRGGPVIDGRKLSYFIMSAGENARLVWTPVQWTEGQFDAAKTQSDVRSRVMRTFTPGQAPASDFISGQSNTLNISDYQSPDAYEWSTAPATTTRPDLARTIFAMNHCEQQAWALVDDPWGVVQDLAALTRLRQSIHENYMEENAEDWAMAGVLRSLAESDPQLAGKMNSITNTRRLNQVWQNMDTLEDRYAEDIANLTECWANWFTTVHGKGIASLDTACGHFDISVAGHRDAIEDSFAAACLGVSDKPKGLRAVQHLLTLPEAPQKPWLIWALLGLNERVDAGRLALVLGLGEAISETAPLTMESAAQFAQAAALSASINLAATRLGDLGTAAAREPIFAAMAPAVSLHLRNWPANLDPLSKTYTAAALSRSAQQLEVIHATHRDVGEWMGTLVGTTAPQVDETALRAASATLPMFRISADGAKTGIAQPVNVSNAANIGGIAPNTVRAQQILDFSKRALQEAPLRSLISLLAAINLVMAYKEFHHEASLRNASGAVGGGFGVIAAGAAITEKIRELDWRRQREAYGATSHAARSQLASALRISMIVQGAATVVSAFNIIVFGSEAIEAYRKGDLDTAALGASLSSASAGQLVLQVKAYRAYRTARVAVLLGQASALRAGTAVLGGPVTFALVSLTTMILGAIVIRQYTQNTPLEHWVAGTRFGTSPAYWSGDYLLEMENLYTILYPVTLSLERYPELNPRTGVHVQNTYLILRLQSQDRIKPSMVRFEGQEVWSGSGFLSKELRVPVNWAARDFDNDAGTRRPREENVARYRRVYHVDSEQRQLQQVTGRFYYSPIQGFELPPMEISESVWI